ncbi:hypothetical protein [Nocardia asteroides]|uniref:hypothetical protein n=1 Tax=Nocardia asteroides TaxID=1824 RepID=UPI001E58A105|nr:hypothetical protein [Nocardia asteroides]UGT55180.1 hypothetical protein LTT85_32140 [Nocardia asteroides]
MITDNRAAFARAQMESAIFVRTRVLVAGVAFTLSLTGTACSSTQDTSTPAQQSATSSSTPPPNAAAIAEYLRNRIATIATIVTITEDNDPNNLIGRPNGYVDAAIAYDSTTTCPDLGTDCGAMVEVWPTPEAAQQRANYIASLQKASPILGTEYHHLHGPVLLRVTGGIKPSANAAYSTAFAEADL